MIGPHELLRWVIADSPFPGITLTTVIVIRRQIPVDQLCLKELKVMPQGVDHDVPHLKVVVDEGGLVGLLQLEQDLVEY